MTTLAERPEQPYVLTLYAVNKAPNGIPTKTHFQKIMHLALKALGFDPERDAQYGAYKYGPFSSMVEDWKNELIERHYLEKNRGSERIRISPEFKAEVDEIRPPSELTGMIIEDLVEFICSLNNDELLLCVYADDVIYNEGMSSKSVVRDDIFRRRREIARGMTKAGKVTVARGAELADMDVMTFREYVKGKS